MPFEFGKPMLDDRALEDAGICARTLHKWYLTMCSKGKKENQLSMTFTDKALLRTGDGTNNNALAVKDLFDLFKFLPMDIALVKFYELYLCRKNQASPPKDFAFLDPAGVSTGSKLEAKDKVRYISNALKDMTGNNKKYLMIPFNEENHWILIVIVPTYNAALYLDSLGSRRRTHNGTSQLIKSAYDQYLKETVDYRPPSGLELEQKYNFECHKHSSTDLCGFYVCHHMRLIVEKLKGDPADLKLPSRQLTKHELSCVREELSLFINTEVIDKHGQYHLPYLK
ncbi:hypothetical protein GQ55_8G253800 [Panicum hallii var. hallii]|uniref:Ubiquitin-like protease family profile domain-containing protein n=1 Tax=Panicum hallii var. hallii TaxID=1504633 RepID=A0A2T7CR30_9POAL|nr:hypothetical protein GQ55_8G253800 [Panicum hallii var. hallii]PUZ45800.1 hypothetical protein GQ55_8G253800 [Panicum hallii var. hallii]